MPNEDLKLNPYAPLYAVQQVTILLHKPVGFDAIQGENPASALVTPESHWNHDASGIGLLQRHFRRLTPLVPLEVDASGLMVLSQDRSVSRRLSGKGKPIEHEYLIEVSGEIDGDGLHRLKFGLTAKGLSFPPCQVSWQSETRLRVAIKSVREGQLREMCAQVSLEVLSIRRLRIGRIPLGKGIKGAMPPGQWRYLAARDRF